MLDLCYSTVTCKVLLYQPQRKLAQLCINSCSKLTGRNNRIRACLVLLLAMLTSLNKVARELPVICDCLTALFFMSFVPVEWAIGKGAIIRGELNF